ncbi:MAG: glycosyltransferase family A protein [Pseudomonadota bacterium]
MHKNSITICIPSYNNATYLERCIDSALAQTYPNIEIIIADDQSSDHSDKIIKSYGDRIKAFFNPVNKGQCQNTNWLVHQARGDYVVILHSDDYLLREACQIWIDMFNKYPLAGMAVGERLETNDKDQIRSIAPFYDHDYLIKGLYQAKVFMFASFLPCQVCFKKDIFLKAGGVHPRYVVNLDGLLWFKLSLLCDVLYTQQQVCVYRYHDQSITAYYNTTIDHMLEFYQTLKEMINLSKGYPYLVQFHQSAVARVGTLALRYGQQMADCGQFALARRQVYLAQYFDPEIKKSVQYKKYQAYIKRVEKGYKIDFYNQINRRKSYTPPPCSIRV